MTKKLNLSFIGKLLLLSATVIWGSSFLILKETMQSVECFNNLILSVRFLLAGLILLAVFNKKIFLMPKSSLIKGLILGVILYLAYTIQTIGLEYTTPSQNAFLTASYCVCVPFMVWFFSKKTPKISNFIAGLLMIVGIAFVGLFGDSESGKNVALGNTLTVICGFFYALQIIFNNKYTQEEDPKHLITVTLITVGALCLITSLIFEIPQNYKLLHKFCSFDVIWRLIYLTLFATLFAQFAQLLGQKFTSPLSASIILSLESVFGTLFSVIMGGEKLNAFMIIGFVIIFIAILMNELGFSIFKKRDNKVKLDR